MYVVSPGVVMALAAVIGACLMMILFRSARRYRVVIGIVGAVGGMAGASIFMLPLNFCTFETERTTLDLAMGIGLMIAGMVVVLAAIHWLASRLIRGQRLARVDAQPGAFRGRLLPFLFLLPTLIILVFFLYYPTLDTFRLSTLLARFGAPKTKFVCMDNFTRLIGDPAYAQTLVTSFTLSFAIVFLSISLALLIAVMAYQPIKGAHIYRTLLIWPYAMSPVVAGVIFGMLFNPIAGVLNHILSTTFGVKVPWLLDPGVAVWTVIAASVWNIMGFNILFYIAGLQNVPGDLLEAASIDGANSVQRFFRITFPLLSPITFFLVVTNTIYAFFDTFGTIDYLTGGGPVNATTTLMYNVYELGIANKDLGKAAAQSIVLFVIVIIVTIIQFRTSRDRVTYGA